LLDGQLIESRISITDSLSSISGLIVTCVDTLLDRCDSCDDNCDNHDARVSYKSSWQWIAGYGRLAPLVDSLSGLSMSGQRMWTTR
jgi:hypothetical protein